MNVVEKQSKKNKKSVKIIKFGIVVFLLTVLSIAGTNIISNTIVRRIVYENVTGIVQRDIALQNNRINKMFVESYRLVHNLSIILPALRGEECVKRVFPALLAEYPYLANIFIAHKDGRILEASDWETPPEWDITTRAWYTDLDTVGFGNIVLSPPFIAAGRGEIAVSFSVWLSNLFGEDVLLGVIISLDGLLRNIEDHILPYEGYLILLDGDNYIIFHQADAQFASIQEGRRTNLRDIPQGENLIKTIETRGSITQFINFMGVRSYFLSEYLETVSWTLGVIIPESVINSVIRRYIIIITFAFTIFVFFILFFAIGNSVVFSKNIEEKEQEINILNDIFFTYSPLVMNVWDENIKLLSTSKQSMEMFNINSMEQYIERFFELSPKFQPCGTLSSEKAVKYVKQAFNEGGATFEWMHCDLDGNPIPTEIILRRFTREKKSLVIAFTVDLRKYNAASERKASQLLQKRLQAMLDYSPICMFILDEKFNVVECNAMAPLLFGMKNKREFIENVVVLATGAKENAETETSVLVQKIMEAFDTGHAQVEWQAKNMLNETIPVKVSIVREYINEGTFAIVYVADLRDRYKNIEMSKRIEVMLDSTPLIVEYWDKDYNLLDCNKAAVEYYRYSSKEQYIKQIKKDFYSWDIWVDILEELFMTGSVQIEFEERQPDGRLIFFKIFGTRTMVNGEPIGITYALDITKERKLKDEHQRAEVAEESSKAKTMFLAQMSHEIRTPINSILNYSELALDDEIPGTTRGHLEKIVTSSRWLLNIINDILDISKIERGNIELEEIPFNLNKLLDDCHSLVLPKAKLKKLQLDFNINTLGKKLLLGDPTKISQILVNLLSNAIKFTDTGFIRLTVNTVSLDDHTSTLKFELTDTGIGMTKQQISQIFTPFMQADSSITRKYGGTGLGLSITKHLIEAMNGELSVESAVGLGSKFSFVLIFKTTETDSNDTGKPEIKKPHFDNGSILVVDDNGMNLDVANELLKRVGLKPDLSDNGKEAINKVKQKLEEGSPYDLILMDIHMPEMDGKETSAIIRELCQTPIIAMTAEVLGIEGEAPYKDFGIEGYLRKPVIQQELWKCLLKYLKPQS